MIKYVFLFAIVGLISCDSTQKTVSETNNGPDAKVSVNEGKCPEQGTCSFELKEGTSYTIEVDGTGAQYPQYKESDGSVAQFRYEEKGPAGTADGDYAEVIQFNVPESYAKGKSYVDEALQDVNLMYHKACFCKGQAGYYKVTKGSLKIFKNKDGDLNFDLQFSMDGLNQTIHRIVRQ